MAIPDYIFSSYRDLGFTMGHYVNSIEFEMTEKPRGEKKIAKYGIKAIMPTPLIIEWNTFKNKVNKNILFESIVDTGTIEYHAANISLKCVIFDYEKIK